MAIDFFVLALLLLSFIINLLALAAFWITPGLRTTANRFTINLLIINIIGCLILAPTLFLSSAAVERNQLEAIAERQNFNQINSISDESIELYSKPGNHQMIIRHNGKLVEEEGIIVQKNATKISQQQQQQQEEQQQQTNDNLFETLFKCNSTYCRELTIDENRDTIVITEFEEPAQSADLPVTISPNESNSPKHNVRSSPSAPPSAPPPPPITMRCWSIDMAAALGALAVLLVVGDTWCAVTDPLRYHSRISGVKAWVFIALTWILGIFFGALSAFRTLDFEADTFLSRKRQRWTFTETYYSLYTSNGIFDMAYACIYFVVIILLPFGFVCGMYWRIFSEARENGLRMRQNGSSPLLQSALNLTQPQQHVNAAMQQYGNSYTMHRHSISSASSSQGGGGGLGVGGLHLQIDQRKASPATMRRDSAAKVLLPTISDDGTSYIDSNEQSEHHLMPVPEQHSNEFVSDRNQNSILLTLQSASGEIKRNYSARQLPILGISSQDLAEADRLKGIRQIHSSPNLQKYTIADLRQDSLTDETTCSAHLLGYNQLQHTQQLQRQYYQARQNNYQQHQHHHHNIHHNNHNQQRRHSHALQIPGGSSPKTFGYMSSLRHRLSNASSLFKYREESRAARISILVVFMFLVSYLPYGFLVLLQSRLPAANFSSSSELAIFMILLGNLTSPFIFAYRNKRVRRGVKRLFGMDAHAQDRSFHSQAGSTCTGNQRNRSSPAIIKRNPSKVSTYSLNSCKFITPQNSVEAVMATQTPLQTATATATGTALKSSLRPNSSCSTIINFMLTKHSGNNAEITFKDDDITQQQQQQQKLLHQQIILMPTTMTTKSTTTTAASNIVTTKPIAAKPKNLLKILFKSSQNLSRSVKSCTQGETADADAEPVEV